MRAGPGRAGHSGRASYIRATASAPGIATPSTAGPDWNFYLAYNMFRIAAILQGIAKRVEAGTASSSEQASGDGPSPMAAAGLAVCSSAAEP